MSLEDTTGLFESLEVLFDDQPRGAAYNMALDEVLLQGTLKLPLLRSYRWERASVSFGYFEPWWTVAECFPGYDLVRRWTGGGVVEHQHDWTYSLLIPRADPLTNLPAGESYRLIHASLRQALQTVGFDKVEFCTEQNTDSVSRACFAKPVRHDLLLAGCKVSGAAQRRTRDGLLHQGSVNLAMAQHAPTTERLVDAFSHCLAIHCQHRTLRQDETATAAALAVSKYATHTWLHRR